MFSRRFIITQVIVLILAAILGLLYARANRVSPLPIYSTVLDFKLKDQHGKDYGLSDLNGKIWVADLIFTTCSGICPTMSKSMAGLHNTFAHFNDVRMVSISVNPENDTPDAMNAYAKKYKAQGDKWVFLTGERDVIQKLAVESFKIGDMKEIVFHSAMFVLVDRHGRIRGYYDGTDDEKVKQLTLDLPQLRKER